MAVVLPPLLPRLLPRDRTRQRTRIDALKQRRVLEARALVRAILLESPCADCGADDPAVLELDHVGPKRREVSVLVSRGLRESALRREIEQCEVVCANCHRRRTARRGRWRRLHPDLRPWRSKAQERNVKHAWSILVASGCIDCGTVDLCVLDFDHVGPKTSNVMKLAASEVGLQRLQTEIANCVVRCANCHRRKTKPRLRMRVSEYPQRELNSSFKVENLAC